MEFEINFNKTQNDEFLIDKLGAYYLKGDEYPGLFIEIKDFKGLEGLLDIVNNEFKDYYSAIISYDPPTIYLDNND